MKIGIVSDVHGDLAALNRALARFDADPEISLILNAGDLIGRGPAQDEVVDAIRARGIPSVRGNHDECDYPLRPDNLAYLHGLPLDWRGSRGEFRIFMCHGKPGNNLWGLYRDHASNALLELMLAGLKTDVLVTGHTHLPLSVAVAGGIVVNPGSLYTFHAARSSSRSFGVLDLSTPEFTVYSSKTGDPVGEVIAAVGERSSPFASRSAGDV